MVFFCETDGSGGGKDGVWGENLWCMGEEKMVYGGEKNGRAKYLVF